MLNWRLLVHAMNTNLNIHKLWCARLYFLSKWALSALDNVLTEWNPSNNICHLCFQRMLHHGGVATCCVLYLAPCRPDSIPPWGWRGSGTALWGRWPRHKPPARWCTDKSHRALETRRPGRTWSDPGTHTGPAYLQQYRHNVDTSVAHYHPEAFLLNEFVLVVDVKELSQPQTQLYRSCVFSITYSDDLPLFTVLFTAHM